MQVYNGCGGEGSINFGTIVRALIPLLPKFKQEKAKSLWNGAEQDVCKPHDVDFYRGGLLLAFLIANFKFSYRFTIKLWWTNIILQILFLPVSFILINIFSIKYFNWCLPWNKRDYNKFTTNK